MTKSQSSSRNRHTSPTTVRMVADSVSQSTKAPIVADIDASLSAAALMLRSAEVVTVLTGAGISADSGIPTFRDARTGWWSRFEPEQLATPEAFAQDPARVWGWYAMRRRLIRAAVPNAAHGALAYLSKRLPRCTLLTQNVDGLHEAAGHKDIISLHGNLMQVRCSSGCSPAFAAPEYMDAREGEEGPLEPQLCQECGSLLRPDVVWFGEPLPESVLERARSAAFACDVFLSVGTSNMVEPAATLPWLAASHGATVLIINPSMAGQRAGPSIVQLVGNAADVLPRLVARAWPVKK